MTMTVAVSGASGRTGYRIAEELRAAGHQVRLLVRPQSVLTESLQDWPQQRLDFGDATALDQALAGCDALVIATGARPSVDLSGPLRVDALAVQQQVQACQRVGLRRLLLVSSLCAGRWLHPLNLFGLILVWKRLGERALSSSGLDWTVIRPGGLSEREHDLDHEGIVYSQAGEQSSNSIPRRLVARCCVEALATPASVGRIIEITSSAAQPPQPLQQVLASWPLPSLS